RQHIDIETLGNKLASNKLKIHRLITYETPFFQKSKPVASCPFVFDTQDISLDGYISHDYTSRHLSLKSGGSSSYLDMRNQTEHGNYSFSAGIRFGYNISYRWNLHTGLNYSQINEKFEYTDPESNQTRIITIKDYIYQNGKIVDSIITEELIIVPGTSKLKVYNKYRTLDIPILARYTLLANNKFSLSAISGLYINLTQSQKGMFLSPDESTPVAFTKGTEEGIKTFKNQLGISVYAGVSLAYHLTSSLDLLLEPNARIQTESMTLDSYPLSQRYNTFGMTTGIRYKF
ncbi:MAG: hypothetical protein H7X99_03570, partial [Saprospiraceae bacterium]|nr:hypothetical protein [Saprospiraceae bacterium]